MGLQLPPWPAAHFRSVLWCGEGQLGQQMPMLSSQAPLLASSQLLETMYSDSRKAEIADAPEQGKARVNTSLQDPAGGRVLIPRGVNPP